MGILGLSFAINGCTEPAASGCNESRVIEFPETPVTKIPSVTLLKTSGATALVGLDGATVRWSLVTEDGKLGEAEAFTLPANFAELSNANPPVKAGPWFALTGVGGASNQLVAIFVAPKPGEPTVTQVMAIGQNKGGTLLSLRPIYETLAGTNPAQIRVAVGSSPSGTSAMVAIGFVDQPGTDIQLFSLGENAQKGPVNAFSVDYQWDCPFWSRNGRSNAPLNFSLVKKGSPPQLVVRDVQESGSTTGAFVTLNADNLDKGTGCPIVVPKEGGLVFGWQMDSELRAGDYRYEGGPPDSYPVRNQANFLGKIPNLVGVGSFGSRTALLWLQPAGPEVGLFDQQLRGFEVGKPLLLSNNGKFIGTPSSVSELGATFVTYRNETGPRRLVTVKCEEK